MGAQDDATPRDRFVTQSRAVRRGGSTITWSWSGWTGESVEWDRSRKRPCVAFYEVDKRSPKCRIKPTLGSLGRSKRGQYHQYIRYPTPLRKVSRFASRNRLKRPPTSETCFCGGITWSAVDHPKSRFAHVCRLFLVLLTRKRREHEISRRRARNRTREHPSRPWPCALLSIPRTDISPDKAPSSSTADQKCGGMQPCKKTIGKENSANAEAEAEAKSKATKQ
jgi:hypothetical protein